MGLHDLIRTSSSIGHVANIEGASVMKEGQFGNNFQVTTTNNIDGLDNNYKLGV